MNDPSSSFGGSDDTSEDDLIVASMSGISANFVYLERKNLPLHTLKLFELRVAEPPSLEAIWAVAEKIVALLPPLRWQLRRTPANLHHPQWQRRMNVDVRRHVRLATQTITSEDDIDTLAGELASKRLPVERRVWDATIVPWADDPKRLLVVVRMHHALADGVAVGNMVEHLWRHWNDPPATFEPPDLPQRADELPITAGRALLRRLQGLAGLPELLAHSAHGWFRARKARARYKDESDAPSLFDTPTTSLDRPLDGQRTFLHFAFPLAEMKEVKDAFGCKIGDVLLTLVGAGLHEYFKAREEAVSSPLVAGVPVALAPESQTTPRLWGNNLSHMPVSLRTDIKDDFRRLRAISRETEASKAIHAAFGSDLLRSWSELSLKSVLRGLFAMTRHFKRPPINLVVSNVPGPSTRLRWDDVEIRRLFSVGPVLDRIGLNVTAWSYEEEFAISVLANAATVADLAPIRRGMTRSLHVLLTRARRKASQGASRRFRLQSRALAMPESGIQ